MADKKTLRTSASGKAKRAVRAKTRIATGKKVKDTRKGVKKATRSAARTAGKVAFREKKGRDVSDNMAKRFEKRIARLEERLDKEGKSTKPSKEALKKRMEFIRARRAAK